MTTQNNWKEMLDFYSTLHAGRRTRLGVFEMQRDVVNDYWIEDGLPLAGITLESVDHRKRVVIAVGEMTHEIDDAIKLTFQCTATGHEDGLDILSRDNRVTVLRLENRP